MSEEAKFEIAGRKYPVPMLDTFDMNEAQVLFDYANVTLEDFAPAHPEWPKAEQEEHEAAQLQKVRNPAFKRALLHVAYARGNPGVDFETVRDVIGRANTLDVTVALLSPEDDASPPEETPSPKPLSKSSDTRTHLRPADSGTGSSSDSGPQGETHGSIGTTRSATSFPEYVPST